MPPLTPVCAAPVEEEAHCTCCYQFPIDCGCARCVTCEETSDATCENCESCCECSCWTCDCCLQINRSDEQCSGCERCQGCCSCEDEEEDAEEYIPPPLPTSYNLPPTNVVMVPPLLARPIPYVIESRNLLICGNGFMSPSNIMGFGAAQPVKFYESKKLTGFKESVTKRFIGAEIEVGGAMSLDKTCDTLFKLNYSIIRDGSLPISGFEIVTQPTNGDLFLDNIYELGNSLKEDKAFVNRECGLHIHADARDIDKTELVKVAKLYAALEPALFALQPTERRNAPVTNDTWFCFPVVDEVSRIIKCVDFKDKLSLEKAFLRVDKSYVRNLEMAKTAEDKRTRHKQLRAVVASCSRKGVLDRYFSLNIHSYFYNKTLECRLHCGTIDPAEITNWAMLFASILDYGVRMPFSEYRELNLTPFTKDVHSVNHKSGDEWIKRGFGPAWDLLLHVAPKKLHPYIRVRLAKFSSVVDTKIPF